MPTKDLAVVMNPKTWGSNRKVDAWMPEWSIVMKSKFWTMEAYEGHRTRLRKELAHAESVNPGTGVEANVVQLKTGGRIRKELAFGSLSGLRTWKAPQAALVEVAHEEELEEDLMGVLAESTPAVVFGGLETIRALCAKLTSAREQNDITLIHVNQSWGQDDVQFDNRETWWRCPQKAALLVGWPLAQTAVYPYLHNLDMKSPPEAYLEYYYLLEIMKPPERPQSPLGKQSCLLLRCHPDRTNLQVLQMAGTLCGSADHWAVSVVLEGDPPDCYERDIEKAYELGQASRDRYAWAYNTLLRGESLRQRTYSEYDEGAKERAKKKLKTMKDEIPESMREQKEEKGAKTTRAPRKEKGTAQPRAEPEEPEELEGDFEYLQEDEEPAGTGQEPEDDVSSTEPDPEIEMVGQTKEEEKAILMAQKRLRLKKDKAEQAAASRAAASGDQPRTSRQTVPPERLGNPEVGYKALGRKRPLQSGPTQAPTKQYPHSDSEREVTGYC